MGDAVELRDLICFLHVVDLMFMHDMTSINYMGCFFFCDVSEHTNSLIFLSLVLSRKRRENQKNKHFPSPRTPKIPGDEGENAQKNKGFLERQKSKKDDSRVFIRSWC